MSDWLTDNVPTLSEALLDVRDDAARAMQYEATGLAADTFDEACYASFCARRQWFHALVSLLRWIS